MAGEDDPMLKAIKARQAIMVLRSWNAGPLFGMAKGKIEYDAERATTLANNLKAELAMDNGIFNNTVDPFTAINMRSNPFKLYWQFVRHFSMVLH